jgi:hypothetical protein
MGTVGATRQDKAHTRQICRDIDWPVWSRGLFWGFLPVSKISQKIDRHAIVNVCVTPHIEQTMLS